MTTIKVRAIPAAEVSEHKRLAAELARLKAALTAQRDSYDSACKLANDAAAAVDKHQLLLVRAMRMPLTSRIDETWNYVVDFE